MVLLLVEVGLIGVIARGQVPALPTPCTSPVKAKSVVVLHAAIPPVPLVGRWVMLMLAELWVKIISLPLGSTTISGQPTRLEATPKFFCGVSQVPSAPSIQVVPSK